MARLTDRQLEIAELVAAGKSNKAIARALGLSRHTVRNHVVRVAARIPGDGPPRLKIMRWYYSRQPIPADWYPNTKHLSTRIPSPAGRTRANVEAKDSHQRVLRPCLVCRRSRIFGRSA